jgi:FkbM family methyltransferase
MQIFVLGSSNVSAKVKKSDEYKRWLAAGGDHQIEIFPFLNEKSKVWEVGYWHGRWVREIVQRYNPFIFAFEPIEEWYLDGKKEFVNNSKVTMFPFGLGSSTRLQKVGVKEDATGIFCPGKHRNIQIKSVVDFITENHIEGIDLLQCNCEGGEYEILPAMIESGLVNKFEHIAIQFHQYGEESVSRRQAIQDGLSKTHTSVFCFDWLWEFWARK